MKLVRVHIKGFRSIEDAELVECGNFNVIIGKNNSGKSNVMSSISNFFKCVHDGDIVQLSPPAGLELDFFNRETGVPITTKLVFSLTEDELTSLKADLASEAPQMKHAAEILGPCLRLAATVSITNRPAPFAYVSTLELEPENADPTVLFAVDAKASLELYRRRERVSRNLNEIRGLQHLRERIDADDWVRLFTGAPASPPGNTPGSGERPPLRNLFRRASPFLRRPDVAEDTLDKLDAILSSRPTYEDFIGAVKAVSTLLQNEADGVESSPLTEKVRTFSGDADTVPIYVRNLAKRLGAIKVLHLRELRRQIGREEAARLLSLKVKRGGRNILNRIEQMVHDLLGVQVDAFESEARGTRLGEVVAELDVDNFLVEANGSGIRESLRLILDIEFESPQIVLVEEPEVHLHPALEITMMQYLRSLAMQQQVFISTHSTNFLDTGQMRNVYLVSKEKSTRIKLLDREEAEDRLPRELGIRLSSIFLFDRLIFVEGPTDEDIVRAWAATLNANFSTANVGFIPIGGVRNMHYFAAASTLEFLAKRQVKLVILVDRDERDHAEIKKLTEALGERAILKVFIQREIENYLVCPKPLSDFIAFKQKLLARQARAPKQPSVAAVTEDIKGCIQELKALTINHRVIKGLCHPIFIRPKADTNSPVGQAILDECDRGIAHLQDIKAKVEKAHAEASQEVEDNWDKNAAALVPGSVLLDCVCQRYGVRFNKDADGVRLASLMEPDEIDDEIKAIIADVSG